MPDNYLIVVAIFAILGIIGILVSTFTKDHDEYILDEEDWSDRIWIWKQGSKCKRIIDIYECDLDVFLENGWHVLEFQEDEE